MANKYVDFSAANDGDGTTAAQAASGGAVGAFNTIVGKTFTAADNIWIRRNGTLTITASFTLSQAVNLIGWPVSGDTFYATRPASGTSNGWDSDANTYAQITCSTSSLATSMFIQGTAGAGLERIKFSNTSATISNSTGVLDIKRSTTINNCYATMSITAGTTISALYFSTNTGIIAKISNSTFESSGIVTAANALYAAYVEIGSADLEFINCTFTHSGTPTGTAIKCLSVQAVGIYSFADCTFTRTGTAATSTCVDFTSAASTSVMMYNCTITDNSTAAATQLDSGSTVNFMCQRLTMLKGRRINLGALGQYLHASVMTQTVASSDYFVNMVGGCTFCCNNFTEFTGNVSGAIKGTVQTFIMVQNTSFQSANPYGAVVPTAHIFEADAGGTQGNWKFTGSRGTVAVDATARTGGEAFSLKFNMSSGSQNYLGMLQAILNMFETIYASLVSGNVSITLYGAHKGYSPAPDKSQIWADCDYFDAGSGSHRAFASSRDVPGTALTSDSSSWTGDTGLTSFKLVIPIVPGQSCLAPIRIFDNLRQASAYFYIDPKPVVA